MCEPHAELLLGDSLTLAEYMGMHLAQDSPTPRLLGGWSWTIDACRCHEEKLNQSPQRFCEGDTGIQ